VRSPKLVRLLKSNSAAMSEALVQKIRASGKCRELLLRVPESEHRKYASEIYIALTEWLESESDSILEPHYVALGVRRAGQGVPANELFWAVAVARESLCDYIQQECFHEEPVEFWGGVMLLRSLNTFFDHVLSSALIGYEKARVDESKTLSFLGSRRSA